MFSKLAIFLASVAVLAVATPKPNGSGASTECCQTTGTASDPAIAEILKGLGINVQDVDGLVGVTCSPITVRDYGLATSVYFLTISDYFRLSV